jgi:chromosome segregation ATPase
MEQAAFAAAADRFGMAERMSTRVSTSDFPPLLVLEAREARDTVPRVTTPATSTSAIDNLHKCHDLQNAVYQRRTKLNLPPFGEPTRDTYFHREQGRHEAESPGLAGTEAAMLVRSLEDRLGNALQRISALESERSELHAQLELAWNKERSGASREVELVARNDELAKQLEIVRAEAREQLLKKDAENAYAAKAEIEKRESSWMTELQTLKGANHSLQLQKESLEDEIRRLNGTIAELRQHLSQNAASLQTATLTIKDLTNDLVRTKQQASNIATAYQKQEQSLRAASSTLHSQTTELDTLRPLSSMYQKEKEARAKAEQELLAAKSTAELLVDAEKERRRLLEVCKRQEEEVMAKSTELSGLRNNIETVRSQANAAFMHSNQFRNTGTYDGFPMGAQDYSSAMAQLRREIEDEERRTADESRRWRAKLSSPTKH